MRRGGGGEGEGGRGGEGRGGGGRGGGGTVSILRIVFLTLEAPLRVVPNFNGEKKDMTYNVICEMA